MTHVSHRMIYLLGLVLMGAASVLPANALQAGDPYADRVVSFQAGSPAGEQFADVGAALGPPDFDQAAMTGWLTLGVGGSITLEFVDNVAVNSSGPDLKIYGDPANDEQWKVELSTDGAAYKSLGVLSEVVSIDLGEIGFETVRFVRLTDDGDASGGISPGAELDAVVALNSAAPGATISATNDPAPTLLAPPSTAASGVPAYQALPWVRTGGPIGGLGYDIRMRPDNPDIMYVTDAWAGVHKSTDGGQTWFTLNEGIDLRTGPSGDAVPVFSLTIDPNNYDIVWIGLQNLGGVYRSVNGGQTWERRTRGIVETEGLTIRGIAVEPGNSNVVYIAGEISSWRWNGTELWGREFDRTQGVVYKTTDGGENWRAIWRGDDLARYIWIDPTNANTLYVSTGIFDREAANSNPQTNTAGGAGILKSTDGGGNWRQVNTGIENLYLGSLFMHPNDPRILIAGAGNNAYPEGGGIYMTRDGGESWERVGGEHITSVEFASSNPNVVYAAGSGDFLRSEDGGKTWMSLVHPRGWGWGPEGIHPGFPIDIQVDLRDPYRIFVNNYGGGNFLSEDGGKTWVSASVGYTGADLRDVFVSPNNPAVLYVNGRSGPFVSRDGGVTWQGINPVDIRDIVEGARVTLDPSNPNHALLSSAHWGWTFESMDGGGSWGLVSNYEEELHNSPYTNTNQKFQGFQAIAFAPSNPKIVYGGFGIWRCSSDAEPGLCSTKSILSILTSTNGGHSWDRVAGSALDGLSVTEIVVHPQNAETAWASTAGGGVFFTSDGGRTWQPVSTGLTDNMIAAIAIDPANPHVLYAGSASRGIFKSEDGGRSWKSTNAGMDPNEQIGSVVVDPLRSNVVYAGSWRSGVYVSQDGGATWRLINNGLRTRSVRALAISSDGETLYAATRGEGVFRLSTHGQDYFNSLAPTPIIVVPTLTPASASAPTSAPGATEIAPAGATQPAAQVPAATPQPSGGFQLPCLGGAAILPLAAVGLVRRKRRR